MKLLKKMLDENWGDSWGEGNLKILELKRVQRK